MQALAILHVAAEDPIDRVAALFDLYHHQLYRLARRLCANDDDARDLVQETYLRAARSAGSIPLGRESEQAWLTRVLINIRRDEWRRTRRRSWLRTLHLDAPEESASTEGAFIARNTVTHALDSLSPRRRAVLVLRELEGHDINEIAQLLGIAVVTVRWHLAAARRELRATILRLGGARERNP
jgi:RNA polymerase sigma-70 factor (ECF subfamily)